MVNNTPVAPRRPHLNPFAFPSDTDLRFILLIVCVLGATLSIYNEAPWQTTGNFIAFVDAIQNCEKSSGIPTAIQEYTTNRPKGEADFVIASAAYAR